MASQFPIPAASQKRFRFIVSSSRQSPGWVHFIGLGGSGLSPLALLALKRGWKVSGSDAAWSSRLKLLRDAGAAVFVGHDSSRFDDSTGSGTVVVSSAIPAENPELVAAHNRGMLVMKRADWLGEVTRDYDLVAVAGTHGKSTTTAMLALALKQVGEDVTAIVGADVPQFPDGNGLLYGLGRRFVLEADEYDGCFLGVAPSIAVVTSVEWEHVDLFRDEESVRQMFKQFVSRIKSGGCLIVCGDSPGPRSLLNEKPSTVRTVTYGLDEQNDWRAVALVPNDHGGTDYTLMYCNRLEARVSLKLPGTYNVLNSLAVIATMSLLTSVDDSSRLQAAVQSFEGIRRRFEYVGKVLHCDIYDDYAHHPTEVRAVLQAARQRFGQLPVWVVFQPHTYSRLAMLLQDFAQAFVEADRVIVTEVFSAREENIWKISGSDLVSHITDPPAVFVATLEEVMERLSREIISMGKNVVNENGSFILLTLGAGDVTTVGPKLIDIFSPQAL